RELRGLLYSEERRIPHPPNPKKNEPELPRKDPRPLCPAPSQKSRMSLETEPRNPTEVGAEHYPFTKEPSVIVWFPPASIASTSNAITTEMWDATNSGRYVTLMLTVTSQQSYMKYI